MNPKCICCCSSEVMYEGIISPVVNFAGQLLSEPLAGGELFRCHNCGLAFRFPQLEKSTLDELYRQGKSDNWQTVPCERQDWQIAIRWIKKYLKIKSTILDIGCFDGGFLNTIEIAHSRFGIEIHEDAAKKAQQHGIKIIGKDISEMTDIIETFDAVTSFDVIEHTQNPLEFLRQMAKVTNKEGILILSTGNSAALSWRIMGSRYWYCTIGEHLSFLSPMWCKWAAKQLGLELKQVIKFCHVYPSWKERIRDLIKNLLYLVAPRGFALLRQMGVGRDEFRDHKEMLSYPPSWISAKDHFICIFKKNVQ